VSLLFDNSPARFGVTMHDQMAQLVRDIESLAIVIPFHGIKDDYRP